MQVQGRRRWIFLIFAGVCLFFVYRQYASPVIPVPAITRHFPIKSDNDTALRTEDGCTITDSTLGSRNGSQRHDCEVSLGNDIKMFTRIPILSDPVLLWLTLTNNSESWGKHNFHRRDVKDFFSLITSQVQPSDVSVALLTSSESEYRLYIDAIAAYDFAKITIIYHPGLKNDQGVDRKHRQDKAIQTARRAELAILRNFLMLHSLKSEPHILWTDSDVHRYDSGIVQRMLSHIETRSDVGLITARCSQGGNDNYDHNAWRGTRKGPRGWDLTEEEIKSGEITRQGQKHVPEIIRGSSNDDLLELDNVGGTILYIRASLIWQGLSFPYQYVVGTRWGKDGWDGIETEGLCYLAKGLAGGKCMVMGGSWHVEHTKE